MKCPRQALTRARGFSLIEVLIAIVLGLVILIAVTNIFISSRQSFRTQEGLSQMQETGRLLNYLMYPYVRLAGYVPDPIKQTDPTTIFIGTDTAVRGENDVAGTGTTADMQPGTDILTVRYRGQDNIAGTAADGSITNCRNIGGDDGVRATETVTSRFYIISRNLTDADRSNDVSSLVCEVAINGGATSTQPILQGVQDLQVLYGVGAPSALTGDRVTQRYYTAATMPTTDWNRVTSVRVTLTVDSIDRVAGNATVAGGSNEGRLRRTFTSTLQIRNRLN